MLIFHTSQSVTYSNLMILQNVTWSSIPNDYRKRFKAVGSFEKRQKNEEKYQSWWWCWISQYWLILLNTWTHILMVSYLMVITVQVYEWWLCCRLENERRRGGGGKYQHKKKIFLNVSFKHPHHLQPHNHHQQDDYYNVPKESLWLDWLNDCWWNHP